MVYFCYFFLPKKKRRTHKQLEKILHLFEDEGEEENTQYYLQVQKYQSIIQFLFIISKRKIYWKIFKTLKAFNLDFFFFFFKKKCVCFFSNF